MTSDKKENQDTEMVDAVPAVASADAKKSDEKATPVKDIFKLAGWYCCVAVAAALLCPPSGELSFLCLTALGLSWLPR
jgi:hypothetical protein